MTPRKPFSDDYPDQVKSQEEAFLFDFWVGELRYVGLTRDEAEGYVATNFTLLKESPLDVPPATSPRGITVRIDPNDPDPDEEGGVLTTF